MMQRRTFLKIMLGTASASILNSGFGALWPADQRQRPPYPALRIQVDQAGLLYDPRYEAEPDRDTESRLDTWQETFREQLENSPYWIGGWLHDHLPNQQVQQLGLTYIEGDYGGHPICAVRYQGDLQLINRVLASRGLNARCARDRSEGLEKDYAGDNITSL